MSRPEQTFKAGAVRASVFLNTIERGGQTIPIRKVVLEVRYRDKDGQWKSSSSFSLNEIPKATTVLQQAYEYLLAQNASDRQEGGSYAADQPTPPAGPAPGPGSEDHTPRPADGGAGPRLIGTYQA